MSELTPEVSALSVRQRCWILFWEFFKIAAFVLGGGYVIISAVENVFCNQRKWITHEEMVDMMVITQSVPGILACNCATTLGYHVAGWRGAFCAVLGTLVPPIAIVLLIASIMTLIPTDHPRIQGAFWGLNACIVGLIFATAYRLAEKVLKRTFDFCILGAVLIANLIFTISPAYLLVSSMIVGIIYIWIRHILNHRSQMKARAS